MTPITINPFRPTRWEHQRDGYQLIWYTKTADLISREKSVYVRGSRGSGKTTLLKSICWEDLCRNSSLKWQRSFTDFSHLGLYIRFPDHISNAFSPGSWSGYFPDAPDPIQEFHQYFSLLVELTCAERALEACHSLRIEGALQVLPAQEKEVVSNFWEEYFYSTAALIDEPRTFKELARGIRDLVRRMNEAASRGTVPLLTPSLPRRVAGELLANLCESLSKAVQMVTATKPRTVAFKFCLDDCEVLNEYQQYSLNSLVRTTKQPISWVVSAVGAFFDSTTTLVVQQPLTDADRRVESLDERGEPDFRELCQAVVSLRLMAAVSDAGRPVVRPAELSEYFPLEERLGIRYVNDIFPILLQRSANPAAKEFYEITKRFVLKLIEHYPGHPQIVPLERSPPYYQVYLLLLWQGREDAFKTRFDPSDERKLDDIVGDYLRPNFQAWLRRKQRAALLHFASVFGFGRLPLGGAPTILALADGSIRDFLEIMGEIYAEYAREKRLDPQDASSLERFAGSRTLVGSAVQTSGIYSASTAFLNGVSSRSERGVDIVLRLLSGLGHLTSILQSDPDDPSVLGRTERGVFVVRFARSGSIDEAFHGERDLLVWHAIKQAEIAGYLRPARKIRMADALKPNQDVRGRSVTIRLHRRFAPNFGFSFRGAYEPVTLTASDIWPLCDAQTPLEPRAWAKEIASKTPLSDVGQLSLQFSDYLDE